MKTKNYFISVLAAAVNEGFEPEMDETLEDVVMKAEEYLLENEPYGHVFEQVNLGGYSPMNQGYSWVDDESDHDVQMSGEIFDFGHSKEEDEVYFRKEEDGTMVAVNWFDIPDGDDRKQYVFVFDKQVKANGKIAWLYDCMG